MTERKLSALHLLHSEGRRHFFSLFYSAGNTEFGETNIHWGIGIQRRAGDCVLVRLDGG